MLILDFAPQVKFKPPGFYDPLAMACVTTDSPLSGEQQATKRYAGDFEKTYEQPGFSPNQEWYRSINNKSSSASAITPSSKGPTTNSGGGFSLRPLKISLFLGSVPTPSRPSKSITGNPNEKHYDFGE